MKIGWPAAPPASRWSPPAPTSSPRAPASPATPRRPGSPSAAPEGEGAGGPPPPPHALRPLPRTGRGRARRRHGRALDRRRGRLERPDGRQFASEYRGADPGRGEAAAEVRQAMDTIAARAPVTTTAETSFERPNYLNSSYGWKSWLLTLDHKRIAILYLISVTAFFALGGIFAGLVRLELLTPEGDLMGPDTYNRVFTMHGVIMVFFFLIPAIPAVLGNFLVPLMVGAKDLAM